MHRRDFIRTASAATAGLTIINFPIRGKMAPSNKIIVAVMGVNSRGAYLAKSFSQLPNVEVAYICDVEEKAIQNGLTALKDAARKPTVVHDIRKLVEQKDFDALVIAAPESLACAGGHSWRGPRQVCICRKALRAKSL